MWIVCRRTERCSRDGRQLASEVVIVNEARDGEVLEKVIV